MRDHIWAMAMAALALAGGALPAATPPPNGGTVAIRPKTAEGDYDPSLQAYADSAAAALAARGFTILPDTGHAAYVVEVVLSRGDVGTGRARVAGQRAASPFGVGVVLPLSTGKSELVPLRRTRLELRMRKRGEPAIVWDGVAVTVRAADTAKGADEAVAADLSQAILAPYPAPPQGMIGVP